MQKPLYEVASSHTAHKTFVGNFVPAGSGPNLLASVARPRGELGPCFRRYRTIDDDEINLDFLKDGRTYRVTSFEDGINTGYQAMNLPCKISNNE